MSKRFREEDQWRRGCVTIQGSVQKKFNPEETGGSGHYITNTYTIRISDIEKEGIPVRFDEETSRLCVSSQGEYDGILSCVQSQKITKRRGYKQTPAPYLFIKAKTGGNGPLHEKDSLKLRVVNSIKHRFTDLLLIPCKIWCMAVLIFESIYIYM
jgi:hypothetical protein